MKKNRRRRKAKATKPQQMPDKPPRQKGTPGGSNSAGHRACWSDSDEPQSKFIKYDSGRVVDFKKDRGPKYFEPVLRVCRSVICLVATTDGWRMFCSGTVVDHVDKKTWILTSATLVRKPDTQFEAYRREEIKICDTSSENYDGIEAGDIISKLDGVALYSVAQFTAMFLDKFEVAMDTPNAVTLQVVVHRPTDKTTFVAKLNVRHVASDECNESFLNRWMEQRGMVCN